MTYGSSGSYREMEVMAMPPARRLVLLYTHLLVALRQARGHIERGEIEFRTERLLRAEEFIHELLISLDRDQGGDLAERLAGLYGWMLGEIAKLHSKPELARFDALVGIISELHEAWEAAANQVTGVGLPAAS